MKYNAIEQTEMEYVVTCVKHLFANHVVLQFSVLNTVDDQRLRDVRYQHTHTHAFPSPPSLVYASCSVFFCSTCPPNPAILSSSSPFAFDFFLTRCSHCTPFYSTPFYSTPFHLTLLKSTLSYVIMTHSPLSSPLLLWHYCMKRCNMTDDQSGCGDLGPRDIPSRVSHQRTHCKIRWVSEWAHLLYCPTRLMTTHHTMLDATTSYHRHDHMPNHITLQRRHGCYITPHHITLHFIIAHDTDSYDHLKNLMEPATRLAQLIPTEYIPNPLFIPVCVTSCFVCFRWAH